MNQAVPQNPAKQTQNTRSIPVHQPKKMNLHLPLPVPNRTQPEITSNHVTSPGVSRNPRGIDQNLLKNRKEPLDRVSGSVARTDAESSTAENTHVCQTALQRQHSHQPRDRSYRSPQLDPEAPGHLGRPPEEIVLRESLNHAPQSVRDQQSVLQPRKRVAKPKQVIRIRGHV